MWNILYLCLFQVHNNLIWYFVKRRKIVPVKKCQLSLCMTGRCLLTTIFKICTKFPFFWYRICLVPKMSNNFDLSHGLSFIFRNCLWWAGNRFWNRLRRVYPCDNSGSGKSPYVYSFQDCRTQRSTFVYAD